MPQAQAPPVNGLQEVQPSFGNTTQELRSSQHLSARLSEDLKKAKEELAELREKYAALMAEYSKHKEMFKKACDSWDVIRQNKDANIHELICQRDAAVRRSLTGTHKRSCMSHSIDLTQQMR